MAQDAGMLFALSAALVLVVTPTAPRPVEGEAPRAPATGSAPANISAGRNTYEARINAAIDAGDWAEAEHLLNPEVNGGQVSEQFVAAARSRMAQLQTKLEDIPATLKRYEGYQRKLEPYTRHEIQRMLEQKNFSVATKKELQTALKLIKEAARLMEKKL